VLGLFASTLCVSAVLLFSVQPMVAKMLLPLQGGAPAVWTTCVVFYQATLLLGYLYAHATVRWLGLRRQTLLHLALLALPWVFLPVNVSDGWTPSPEEHPTLLLLLLLVTTVGLPFFVVASHTPLLQSWFSGTTHTAGRDPYFLYGASNLGSLLALVMYPIVIEPLVGVQVQREAWAIGYAVLSVLVLTCACAVWWRPAAVALRTDVPHHDDHHLQPSTRQRLRWVGLSAVPSSLMLSVTTYTGAEVAAVPLLWVMPLAIYLASFVLTFARRPVVTHRAMIILLPVAVLPPVVSLVAHATGPAWLFIPLHLLALFPAAMVCHGELARSRPIAQHLTQFYLWIAAGGTLGGLFNVLLAPVIFNGPTEYPLGLVLVCLLRPSVDYRVIHPSNWRLDVVLPLLTALMATGLAWVASHMNLPVGSIGHAAFVFGLPLVICATFWPRSIRFGLGIAGLLVVSLVGIRISDRVLLVARDFFGSHRVVLSHDGHYRQLIHGTTLHGMQAVDRTRRQDPLAYYSRTGPAGDIFAAVAMDNHPQRVAVIGLGVGTLACYARANEHWTFYEIDPGIVQIATDRRHFSFLAECLPQYKLELGDARQTLSQVADAHYDLIVMDAFNSDAIPAHLITREAIQLYRRKLAPRGLVAFHISNRHLNLEPILASGAEEVGLVGVVRYDRTLTDADRERGTLPSHWVVLTAEPDALTLFQDNDWDDLSGADRIRPWTDDFSNILTVLKWH